MPSSGYVNTNEVWVWCINIWVWSTANNIIPSSGYVNTNFIGVSGVFILEVEIFFNFVLRIFVFEIANK